MTYEISRTCMLINMGLSRSDCASWVQAWGSIAAIVGAGLIAWWQWRRVVAHDLEKRTNAAKILGVELYFIVQHQISMLKKLDDIFKAAREEGSIANTNEVVIKWCIESMLKFEISDLKEMAPAGIFCAKYLASARAANLQLRVFFDAQQDNMFNLAAAISLLHPPVKEALKFLYLGRSELHDFLGYPPEISPMHGFPTD